MGDEKLKTGAARPYDWFVQFVQLIFALGVIFGVGTVVYITIAPQFNFGGGNTQIIETPTDNATPVGTQIDETPASISLACVVEDEVGIPANSTETTIIVEPNQFHMWASAQVSISYQNEQIFSLGSEVGRGNMFLFLPVHNDQPTIYDISNVNVGSNWHGWWTDCANAEAQLESKAFNMTQPNTGNCSADGCDNVYMITIQGDEVVITPFND